MKKFKKIVLVLIVIALIAAIVALTTNIVMSKVDKKANPIVTMEVEGYGTIKIELYPNMAPNTVKNFIRLAQRGFYNGKTFSDLQDGLVLGGKDIIPEGSEEKAGPKIGDIRDLKDGEENDPYGIEGEFIENGFNGNTLSHQRGVISMNRSSYNQYKDEIAMLQLMGDTYSSYIDSVVENMYDSQSSDFFILTEDETGYDGTYTGFGKVIDGMGVVDNIAKLSVKTSTSEDGKESKTTEIENPPVISKVTVETYGVDYGEPTTIGRYDFDATFNMLMQMYMQSNSSTSAQ